MVRDDTLLSRYFGVYTLLYRGADIKIVVMENVSYMFPRLPIHRKYDLKGSWEGRNTQPLAKGREATCQHCNQAFIVGQKAPCPCAAAGLGHPTQ